MRVGSFFTGGSILVSGYLLANLCSAAALLILYRLIAEKSGSSVATRAIILLLLYPGSVFFFFPYTESLFLLLVSLCFFSLQRQQFRITAAISFLLPLARPVGIFIFPVLLWHAFRGRGGWKRWAVCAAPLLGYLCYFGIMQAFTGNPFEGFEAQQQFPAQPEIGRIFDVPGFLQSFADFGWRHDLLRSFVDRGFFLLFLCGLYWILRLGSVYFVYSIFFGLVPALSNSLMSYTRFMALVFPLFVVAACLELRRSWLFYALCAVLGIAQLYFLVRHITGQWAG